MGIFDVFRPKWKHPNPNVREAGVKRLDDKTLLAEIAKTDSSDNVRIAAVERLDDQTILTKLAGYDSSFSVRMAAARRLNDKEKQGSIYLDLLRKTWNQEILSKVLPDAPTSAIAIYFKENYTSPTRNTPSIWPSVAVELVRRGTESRNVVEEALHIAERAPKSYGDVSTFRRILGL